MHEPTVSGLTFRVNIMSTIRETFEMAGSASSLRPTSRLPYPSDCTSLPLTDKVVELIERAGGFTDQENRLMVHQGIEMGRGGIFLKLTEEQYATLRKR